MRAVRSAIWPRLQLVELHEQPWLPEVLRRALTEYLATAVDLMNPFEPLAQRVAALCELAETDHVVDLCAGAGGPWARLHPAVVEALGRPVRVTMTDLHPNVAAYTRLAEATGGAVIGHSQPVDARAVPDRLTGVRTLFDGFHHFRPNDARAMLADAHRRRTPMLVAEVTRRSLAGVLGMLPAPLAVLALTPRIRPRTVARLIFTYVVPIIPLLVLWDGIVSCLRTYRPGELRALAPADDDYRWEVDEYRVRGMTVTVLVGAPNRMGLGV